MKTACEEAADWFAKPTYGNTDALMKRLRAEGRELKRRRKLDYEKLLDAWVYQWQQAQPNMNREGALRCIALVVEESESAQIQKARKAK